jgi:hypothetical protein
MRTPSSALPAWPHGFVEGFGKPFATAAFFATGFFDFSFVTFFEAAFGFAFALAFTRLAFFVAIIVPLAFSLGVMPANPGIQLSQNSIYHPA